MFGILRGKKIILIIGVLFVMAATLSYIIYSRVYDSRAKQYIANLCVYDEIGNIYIEKFYNGANPNILGFGELVRVIDATKQTENSINCLYIKLKYYTLIVDAEAANNTLSRIEGIATEKGMWVDKRIAFESKEELRSNVEYLKTREDQIKGNLIPMGSLGKQEELSQ